MQTKITVPTYLYAGSEVITYEVEADVDGGYAVHRAVNRPGYELTHVKSGISFGHDDDGLNRLLACREYLRGAKIGGAELSEMPACELCANALIISEIVRSRTPVDSLLERASYVASVVCKA